MTDGQLPFAASLKAVLQRIKITFDANVFPREANKLSDLGMTSKRKMLFECDGKGKIRIRPVRDPIDTIKELDKLRREKKITEDEYAAAKKAELDKLGKS